MRYGAYYYEEVNVLTVAVAFVLLLLLCGLPSYYMYLDRRHAEVCRAAVKAADHAQGTADSIEMALDTLATGGGETDQAEALNDMIDLLAAQYGVQETLTAACLGRPLKPSRILQKKAKVSI